MKRLSFSTVRDYRARERSVLGHNSAFQSARRIIIRDVFDSSFGSSKFRVLADENEDAKTCLGPSLIQRLMKSLFQDQFNFFMHDSPKGSPGSHFITIFFFCLCPFKYKIPFISKYV